ncbi:uncharacterized protein LOC133215510 [Neopsephotus bourkii]|uniref:uncharacterized protein LOC133215510 n=1 Tax=Neopsephotus bourkii TaxID=309878 RepID=UPI002AA59D12|nr:uncharacterized protein LOC133215510 [Neopsephotus bourkii]
MGARQQRAVTPLSAQPRLSPPALSTSGSEMVGAVGSSITFQLQSPRGSAAAWSFHNDVVVTVRFGDPPEATFFEDSFKPRLSFPGNGSALSISPLRLEDAGTYTAKSAGVKSTFTLRVYGELEAPSVTCTGQNCSAGPCRFTLRCAAAGAGAGDVSYAWSVGSGRSPGATVTVEEPPPGEPLLACTAQNPVSSRNVTVSSAAALCAGGKGTSVGKAVAMEGLGMESPCHCSVRSITHPHAVHRCSSTLDRTPSSGQAVIAATVVAGSAVLLASLLLVVCCKPKGERSLREPAGLRVPSMGSITAPTPGGGDAGWRLFHLRADEAVSTEPRAEYTTVYAQVGPFQQTDDEKMGKGLPGCGEQEEKTLYSLVNLREQYSSLL